MRHCLQGVERLELCGKDAGPDIQPIYRVFRDAGNKVFASHPLEIKSQIPTLRNTL